MPEKIFKLARTSFGRMRKRILKMFTDRGILLDPSAVEALEVLPDPMECARRIVGDVGNRALVLGSADIERYCDQEPPPAPIPSNGVRGTATRTAQEKPRMGVTVVKEITGESTCVGNVIDFAKLFNDRYGTLKKMLARRRELAGLIPISKAKKLERDLRFAGIVNDVRTTKNGHTIIEMEDDSDRVQVLVMKGSRNMDGNFIKDEVLGVIGASSRDGEIVIAKEIVRPDVPVNSRMTPNGSDSIVAFVSDIHVGSNTFLPKEWGRFVDWLNSDPIAKDIRYMVMPGDLVDGIGIYPGQ
jgi:DNA polymerase II small subunit